MIRYKSQYNKLHKDMLLIPSSIHLFFIKNTVQVTLNEP